MSKATTTDTAPPATVAEPKRKLFYVEASAYAGDSDPTTDFSCFTRSADEDEALYHWKEWLAFEFPGWADEYPDEFESECSTVEDVEQAYTHYQPTYMMDLVGPEVIEIDCDGPVHLYVRGGRKWKIKVEGQPGYLPWYKKDA